MWSAATEVKRVEATAEKKNWPVYKEITRQDRAEKASRELEGTKDEDAGGLRGRNTQAAGNDKKGKKKRMRKFQRQNDKFLGKEPKVRKYDLFGDQVKCDVCS
jgi:hypothetical protein